MSFKGAKLTFCTHLHLITEIQGQSMLPILHFVKCCLILPITDTFSIKDI